jgi:hypothetical protein
LTANSLLTPCCAEKSREEDGYSASEQKECVEAVLEYKGKTMKTIITLTALPPNLFPRRHLHCPRAQDVHYAVWYKYWTQNACQLRLPVYTLSALSHFTSVPRSLSVQLRAFPSRLIWTKFCISPQFSYLNDFHVWYDNSLHPKTTVSNFVQQTPIFFIASRSTMSSSAIPHVVAFLTCPLLSAFPASAVSSPYRLRLTS